MRYHFYSNSTFRGTCLCKFKVQDNTYFCHINYKNTVYILLNVMYIYGIVANVICTSVRAPGGLDWDKKAAHTWPQTLATTVWRLLYEVDFKQGLLWSCHSDPPHLRAPHPLQPASVLGQLPAALQTLWAPQRERELPTPCPHCHPLYNTLFLRHEWKVPEAGGGYECLMSGRPW